MIANNNDITFFLGAGFSKDAGAPTQAELMHKVLFYNGHHYNNPIEEYQERLRSFLYDAFSLDNHQMKQFSLEDFYTPIDKCISENSSFRGYSVDHIKQVRNELSVLISIVIDSDLVTSSKDKTYLDSFIEFIYNNRRTRENPEGFDYNIITTNWDILLDSRIYTQSNVNHVNECIDYGTETLHLHKYGVQWSLRNYYRNSPIRLYKIHGSLNWLKCPSCNRLYVNPVSKIAIADQNLNQECYKCKRTFIIPENANGSALEPQIIYPTFLKNLSNIHFNTIWQKAGEVLTRSRKVVFIGYSFQQADYEIRQLLSRKVPDNCDIICVLKGEQPNNNDDNYWMTPEARYSNFFGRRNITFSYEGARKWIKQELIRV